MEDQGGLDPAVGQEKPVELRQAVSVCRRAGFHVLTGESVGRRSPSRK